MKKIILVCVLIVVSCTTKTKSIIVGVNAEYPPYEYLDGQDIVGFNPDIVRAALKEAGYEMTFANMTFDGLLPALQLGKVDLVIGASPTEERKKVVDFSDLYSTDQQVLLVNISNSFPPGEYTGKKIAAQLGTKQEGIIRGLLGAELVIYPNYTVAILDLKNQKIDGIVASQIPATGYRKFNPFLSELEVLEVDHLAQGYAFAIMPSNKKLKEELNQALAKLKADGIIEQLQQKYLEN
ncbi:MAG: transporter substrate-binding domain-containing protein [Brevinema sp.]